MAAPEKYTDIEAKLGEPLGTYLTRRRSDGLSWRLIAVEVHTKTEIDIAGETLRVWHQGITPITSPGATSPAPGNGERAA